MTCARTVSGVGAAAQTAESIALSSQVGSTSWAMTAEMGAIETKVFLFTAFAPHPLHTCKGSVRFGGGAGGRDRRRGSRSSPKRQQDTCGRPRVGGGARAQAMARLVEQPTGLFQSLRNSLGQGTPRLRRARPCLRFASSLRSMQCVQHSTMSCEIAGQDQTVTCQPFLSCVLREGEGVNGAGGFGLVLAHGA